MGRFYIGATTGTIEARIQKHLQHSYGDDSFTALANDWVLFMAIECQSMRQATLVEGHIKKMKSSKYIENLVKYPEIVQKLLERY